MPPRGLGESYSDVDCSNQRWAGAARLDSAETCVGRAFPSRLSNDLRRARQP
jgi:hypothetical protein